MEIVRGFTIVVKVYFNYTILISSIVFSIEVIKGEG